MIPMTMRVAMIGPLYLSYILIASAIPMPEQPNIQYAPLASSSDPGLVARVLMPVLACNTHRAVHFRLGRPFPVHFM